MMMAAPTPKIYRVTSAGNGIIANFNQVGGPQGVWVGTGASSPNDKNKFANTAAGTWATPSCWLLEFKDNTASQVGMGLEDYISNLENFFDGVNGNWVPRLHLRGAYLDPASILQATIETGSSANWFALPYGAGQFYAFDSNLPSPTNDGVVRLLTPHASNAARHSGDASLSLTAPAANDLFYTNFFIYWSMKPKTLAATGTHGEWGPRISYLYPGM